MLTDQDGKDFTEQDLIGKWSMVYVSHFLHRRIASYYCPSDGKETEADRCCFPLSTIKFGFTNCPDICPEELDKMGLVVKGICELYCLCSRGSGTDYPSVSPQLHRKVLISYPCSLLAIQLVIPSLPSSLTSQVLSTPFLLLLN